MNKDLSGPVDVSVYEFEGRRVTLLSDRHNSKDGSCGDCVRFVTESKIFSPSLAKCVDLPVYIHRLLQHKQGTTDFYFESPFVIVDSVLENTRERFEDLDYIDTMTETLKNCLLRDKSFSPYLPHSRVHYVDIRDIYDKPHSNGQRYPSSANPFSGSWINKLFKSAVNERISGGDTQEFKQDLDELVKCIMYIIDNAITIATGFIGNIDIWNSVIDMWTGPDVWKNRMLLAMKSVTSVYKNRRMHRVAKQIEKLNCDHKQMVMKWFWVTFNSVLDGSKRMMNDWILAVSKLTSSVEVEILSAYRAIKELPTMILIPLSSVIMDMYQLSRFLYHQSDKACFFSGSAHIQNCCSFFEMSGAKLLDRRVGDPSKIRCIRS